MAVYVGIKFDVKPLISVIEVRGPYCELIYDSFLGEGHKFDINPMLNNIVFSEARSLSMPEKASDSKVEGNKLIKPGYKFKVLKTGE